MRVFQQVVEEGGFAAAARKLDLARPPWSPGWSATSKSTWACG